MIPHHQDTKGTKDSNGELSVKDSRNIRAVVSYPGLSLSVLGALGVLGALVVLPAFASPKAPAGPAFGEAAGGVKIAFEILPADWRPNARVEFACTVLNAGDAPVRTTAWGFDLAAVLEIRDAAGKVIVPEVERAEAASIPRGILVTLAPGESRRFVLRGRITPEKALVVGELAGGTWTWPLREGSLSVRAAFERSATDPLAAALSKQGYWTGKAASPATRVVMTGEAIEPGAEVNGLRLHISAENTDLRMVPDGAGAWTVEPAKIELSFVNEGADELKVNARDLLTGLVRFEIDGPDEQSVRVTRADAPVVLGDKTDVALLDPQTGWTPQAPITFPGKLGGSSYELLKPGQYRVTAVYASRAAGLWTGLVQSNVLTFNVMGGPTPGGTIVKGLKLELSSDAPEILIDGDPAKLTIAFTNTGKEPLRLDAHDLFWKRLKLSVTGPDGKPFGPESVSKVNRAMATAAEGDYPTLEPGKSWSETVKPRFPGEFGPFGFKVMKPGAYRLKVTYEVEPPAKEGEIDPLARGCWTGVVTSNELTLNVIAALKRK